MNAHSTLRAEPRARQVLIATDSWDQTNGITTLYRSVIRCLDEQQPRRWRLLIVHPADRASDRAIGCGHRAVAVTPRLRFHLPQYPEIVTGYVKHEDFRRLEQLYGAVDVVHVATQGLLGLSAARYAARDGKPCVGFYHTNWPAYVDEYLPSVLASRFKAALARRWDRMVYGPCGRIIAHTGRTDPCLSPALKAKLAYSSSFVDVRRFAEGGSMPERDRNVEPVVFGFVGRLAREKNLASILNHADTIARLGCRLLIVGDGPERARLAQTQADFVGFKHGDDLVEMYRTMRYLLLPARSDTLGLVVLEAAACGTPAVALRGTPAADLILRYGCGVVVDDFDAGVFRWLLEMARTDRYTQMQARARDMAAGHDVSAGTRVLVDAWNQACGEERTCESDPSRITAPCT